MAVSSEARIATNINSISFYKALNNMRISLLYYIDTISRMGDVNLTEEQIKMVKLQILQNIAIAQLLKLTQYNNNIYNYFGKVQT